MSRGILRFATAMGLLLYAGVGFYTMLLGGNYLEYDVIAADPTKGQHIGILVIEAGVGITVASVMIAIFFTFAGRRKADQA